MLAGDLIRARRGAGRSPVGRVRSPRSRQSPPFVLWAPALAVAFLMALPLLYLVLRTAGADGDVWRLVFRVRTASIAWNTAALAAAVGAASVVVSVPLAWFTVRTNLPGRRAWELAASLPLVIPSYVGALAIIAALGPRGLLHEQVFALLGVERLPSIYGFWGSWLALTLFTYPYVYLSVRAALKGLDPSLEEASRCLGHGAVRTFVRCVLPQLRPAIAVGTLLSALYTVSDFGVVTLMRYDVFTRAVYVQYRSSFDRAMAAALALLLVAFTVVLLLAEARVRGRATWYRVGSGAARTARRVDLGRWRWPATLYCALICTLSLALPIAVLLYWMAHSLSGGERLSQIPDQAANSIGVGLLAAIVTAVLALPIAILAARYRGRFAVFAERLTYLGYALPGIVIALAFVFIGANFATPLYQTMALLVIAYAVRFLPQAVAAQRVSLAQISPRLEEAARGLGRSSVSVIAHILVPIARPGVLAGVALVMLTVMKELPVTLLLSPIGFETLATEIWQATTTGSFGRAAAPALALILLSAVPSVVLSSRDGRGP